MALFSLQNCYFPFILMSCWCIRQGPSKSWINLCNRIVWQQLFIFTHVINKAAQDDRCTVDFTVSVLFPEDILLTHMLSFRGTYGDVVLHCYNHVGTKTGKIKYHMGKDITQQVKSFIVGENTRVLIPSQSRLKTKSSSCKKRFKILKWQQTWISEHRHQQ